ncbi:hypothetical protein D3C86_993510 [compost metagenome]
MAYAFQLAGIVRPISEFGVVKGAVFKNGLAFQDIVQGIKDEYLLGDLMTVTVLGQFIS